MLIQQIINYYEQYNLSNDLLDKFEKKITDAETLLEVFDVMKEMFEILMNHISSNATNKSEKINFCEMDEEEQNEKENLEKVLQKYQNEIRTHIKTQKELQKLVIELNTKVDSSGEQLKNKNDYIHVTIINNQKLEKDCENLLKRNDELETTNIDYKKYCDGLFHKQKSSLGLSIPHQNTSLDKPSSFKKSKSRNKKSTPRSPVAPNRILRSYNIISQANQNLPFKNLTKTLKSSNSNQRKNINCSMNDITNKSIANCMINNLYFLPKTLKRQFVFLTSVRSSKENLFRRLVLEIMNLVYKGFMLKDH